MSESRLIVGLGNPGKRYEATRHNLGFRVVRQLAKQRGIKLKKSLFFKAFIGQGYIERNNFFLLLPLTYMNNSGKAVKLFIKKRNIAIGDILIVSDDLNLNIGGLRLRAQGSDGGHNGLHSVIEHLATKNIARLKLGIDRPSRGGDVVDFVLSEFTKGEIKELDAVIHRAVDCCMHWLLHGTARTMTLFNKGKKNE